MKDSLISKMIREALLENLLEAEDKKETPTPAPEKKEPKPDELGVTNSNPSAPDPNAEPKDKNYDGTPKEQADAIGLVYQGWGYYGETEDGPALARAMQGKLVRIDPNKAPVKAKAQPNADDPYSLGAQLASGGKIKLPTPTNSEDPYAGDTPIPLRKPRSQMINIPGVTGTEPLKKPDDTAPGGFGTFKGHVPTQGFNVTANKVTPKDITSAERDAAALTKRIGADGAIKKIEGTMKVTADKLKMLANHNSNSSPERLQQLERLEKAVKHNQRVLRALKGEPIGEPGEIEPPTHEDGTPYEVNVNGKQGIVDMVDEENKTLYVTFDDGSWAKIPYGGVEKAATSKDIKFGAD